MMAQMILPLFVLSRRCVVETTKLNIYCEMGEGVMVWIRLTFEVNPIIVGMCGVYALKSAWVQDYLGQKTLTDKFLYSFGLQEQAVHSEDCKLVMNYGLGWAAYVTLDAQYDGMNLVSPGEELALNPNEETEEDKPSYKWIEVRLNGKRKRLESSARRYAPRIHLILT